MTDFFLNFENWDGYVSALGDVIDLEESAREAGAFQRSRKIADAQSLLRLAMLYGPCGLSLHSTSAWAASAGTAELSDVGVLKRLRRSADWLEMICHKLLADRIEVPSAGRSVVSLVDGTTIMGPGKGGQEWRLHCRYGASGRFQNCELTDRHGGESFKRFPVQAGDVVIGDRAYARSSGLEHIRDSGADFIVRSGWRALSLASPNGDAFNLQNALKAVTPDKTADIAVAIRVKGRLVPARLILRAKSKEAKAAEVKRIKRKQQLNGRIGDPRSIEAAGFIIVVTSLDADTCDADQILAMYRARWQIELAFKRLKSLIHIDRLPARDTGLAKAWLYSHLIFALLIRPCAGLFPLWSRLPSGAAPRYGGYSAC